jgi:hypothetical protein
MEFAIPIFLTVNGGLFAFSYSNYESFRDYRNRFLIFLLLSVMTLCGYIGGMHIASLKIGFKPEDTIEYFGEWCIYSFAGLFLTSLLIWEYDLIGKNAFNKKNNKPR